MNRKSVRVVHTRVKVAYKAHNEAAKEYLKRYRENRRTEEMKAKSNTSNTGELVSVIKEEASKKRLSQVGAVDTRKEEEGKIVFKTLETANTCVFD